MNEDGWEDIFSELRIVDRVNKNGYFDITATQIKKISKREPRLMAKIDFRQQLPKVMKGENLAILAIANGVYRIGRFDPFIPISTESKATPERITFPSNIITLNPQELPHESAVLDAALVSGALRRVFSEEVALTIRGRSRSTPFNLIYQNIQFPVSGVQIEVDGGYEGATTVNLVEAKIGSRDNINIRQLVYPQLAWEKDIGGKKIVKTFICFYQEPILRFIPIVYENGLWRADSAREMAFTFEQQARLELASIVAKLNAPFPVLGIPFPQADRFDTILAMLSIVGREKEITKERLASDFDIVPRQIDYYSNILRWLGLATVKNAIIRLTKEGSSIVAMSHAERMQKLASIIFGEPIFNYVLHHGAENVPKSLFKRWKLTASTIDRRLQTVNAWIRYFQSYEKRQ